jgi:TolB protein
MLMKAIFLVSSLLLVMPDAAKAAAAVTGEIVGQGGQRFPIAVSPLRNLGANTADSARLSTGIADAMVHDLELSGWFRVLDRSAYIENAQKSGITSGHLFQDWSTIGAEGLVKAVSRFRGRITVELRLFDVYQNKERIGKRYTGRVRDFRRIAHKFVDEIINQFTGVPGVLNTRIVYVSNSGGRFKEIYVSHLDGSEKFQVTDNHTINLSPSWSPDGRSVIYSSFKDRNQTLYVFELLAVKANLIPRRVNILVEKYRLTADRSWRP